MLKSRLVPDWPRLAWRVQWQGGPEPVRLDHGPGVEVRADRFFEGVWNGDFVAGAFQQASAMCGSGGVCTSEGLLLVPPFHPQERIYAHRTSGGCLHASNSLPLLLATVGDEPDPEHSGYYFDLLRTLRRGRLGAHRPYPSLRFRNGTNVLLLEIDHTVFGPDLVPRRTPKPMDGFEASYPSYRNYLADQVVLTIGNARAPGRLRPMEPVVPVTEGYDSVAVAALARQAGVRDAYTFVGAEDGRAVAGVLDLDCRAWRIGDDVGLGLDTLKLFFSMPIGQNRLMATAEERITDRLVLMGHGGDDVWSLVTSLRGSALRRPFDRILVANSYAEYRLRAGFVGCPVPLVGAESNTVIQRITRSKEMAPWRLPGRYSRPIPRRIAEEAGVPRAAFGQRKRRGEMRRPRLMPESAREDFLAFCRRRDIDPRDHPPGAPQRILGALHERWTHGIRRRASQVRLLERTCGWRMRDWVHRYAGDLELFTFHWACEAVIEEYRRAAPEEQLAPRVA